MSNRTCVELNHDFCPAKDDASLANWARRMRYYMSSGDPKWLPVGVEFKHMRHHTEPDPCGGRVRGNWGIFERIAFILFALVLFLIGYYRGEQYRRSQDMLVIQKITENCGTKR